MMADIPSGRLRARFFDPGAVFFWRFKFGFGQSQTAAPFMETKYFYREPTLDVERNLDLASIIMKLFGIQPQLSVSEKQKLRGYPPPPPTNERTKSVVYS